MEFLSTLWVPILVSAVLVWIASFLTHMVIPIHKGEWGPLPDEEKTMADLTGMQAGNYMMPCARSASDMKDPAFEAKMKKGPCGTIIVWDGAVNMGRNLMLTFLSCLIVSFFTAYLLWHAFNGTPGKYLEVFRIAGVAAFMTHGLGVMPFSIWYRFPRMWSTLLDALIYAAVTAGSFAWLWHQNPMTA